MAAARPRDLGAARHALAARLAPGGARAAARAMVAAYFVNAVWGEVEAWRHLRTPEAHRAVARWADEAAAAGGVRFPLGHVLGVLPAALAAAHPGSPWACAAALLAWTAGKDAWLTWRLLKGMLLHGARLTELLVKQLALVGAAAMVLADSLTDGRRRALRTAGLLRASDAPPRPGARRSTLLLLGRLMVAALLVQRMRARAEAARFGGGEGAPQHYGRPDPRDSWLLLGQCALALPLALGVRTRVVARALAAALLLHAVSAWSWWDGRWPSWALRATARESFFANVAVAGGLVLMQAQGAGPGALSVDALRAGRQD
ncbi:hypothetical protein HT031_001516 [Scenedesmus sp. PABB004]|nr:hypothetical protein HT031_001516 [Scenedesmus sp. PABB004]